MGVCLWVFDDGAACFLQNDPPVWGGVFLEIRKVFMEHGKVVVSGISLPNSVGGVLVA
jgi:hypothetical protein